MLCHKNIPMWHLWVPACCEPQCSIYSLRERINCEKLGSMFMWEASWSKQYFYDFNKSVRKIMTFKWMEFSIVFWVLVGFVEFCHHWCISVLFVPLIVVAYLQFILSSLQRYKMLVSGRKWKCFLQLWQLQQQRRHNFWKLKQSYLFLLSLSCREKFWGKDIMLSSGPYWCWGWCKQPE